MICIAAPNGKSRCILQLIYWYSRQRVNHYLLYILYFQHCLYASIVLPRYNLFVLVFFASKTYNLGVVQCSLISNYRLQPQLCIITLFFGANKLQRNAVTPHQSPLYTKTFNFLLIRRLRYNNNTTISAVNTRWTIYPYWESGVVH